MVGTTSAGDIDAVYRAYGQRGATPSEIGYWQGRLAANPAEDTSTIRHSILNDPALGGIADNAVRALYEIYGGRAAQSAEVKYWHDALYNGQTLAGVRAAVVSDPILGTHVAASVAATFTELRGTAGSSSEIADWAARVRSGADLTELRAQLLTEPVVQERLGSLLSADYDTVRHRAPTSAEIGVWSDLFAHGATHDTVIDALLTDGVVTNGILGYDSAGYNHLGVRLPADFHHAVVANFSFTNDSISFDDRSILTNGQIYDYSKAREIRAADGSVDTLLTYDATHDILLKGISKPELPDSYHVLLNGSANPLSAGIYGTHMGRSADQDELAFWKAQLAAGTSADTVLDTVLTDQKTSGYLNFRTPHTVHHLTANDTWFYTPQDGDFIVYGFGAARNQVQDHGIGYFSGHTASELLSMAREVTSLDGRTDVLIDLTSADHARSFLLVDVHLADLSASNFLL